MKIKEYISSGILEAYLMGELSPEEAQQVETMADKHQEVKEELNRIELALEKYAILYGTSPPAGTLNDIQDKVTNSNRPPRTSGPGKSTFFTTLALAIVGIGVSTWAVYNFGQVQQTLTQTQEELTALQVDCEAQTERLNSQEEMIELLLNPELQSVRMQGTGLAPEAIAQVFVNPNTQKVYLDTGTLPEAASDKSYQLWALVDGQPIDMGVFELKASNGTLQEVPFIAGAQTYAVTLEEAGGRPTPNLEQLYVIGNVG